jgi:hypothetical protein
MSIKGATQKEKYTGKPIAGSLKYGESSVDRIEKIRSDNNRLWMTLLRIALEKAPKRTKAILAEIKANDEAISRNMQELTK